MVLNNTIKVEVAYAQPDRQHIIAVELTEGSTMLDAIQRSGILIIFPEIDLSKQKIGIFSQQCLLSDPIKAGDRVEIYRPLTIDPKEARRAKAKKNKR
jgi:hypothetical protein